MEIHQISLDELQINQPSLKHAS